MTLDQSIVGKKYEVAELKIDDMIGRRLEALGLTQGTRVELLNKKGNGAIIFKVRGTRLAVGKQIARAIAVKEA